MEGCSSEEDFQKKKPHRSSNYRKQIEARLRLQRQAALESALRKGKGTTSANSDAERHVPVKRKSCDLDFDTLDCPICLEHLSPPVFQCRNGHTICAACCKKVTKGCPSCSKPVGRIRNLAVEKILESVQVSCKNSDQGCQEMLKYSKRKEHEEQLCKYRPFHCPVSNCKHECIKSAFRLHFEQEHGLCTGSTFKVKESVQKSVTMTSLEHFVMLQDRDALFLVHHEYEDVLGHVFFCTSFEASNRIVHLVVKIGPSQMYFRSGNYHKRYGYTMDSLVHDNQGEEGSVLKVKERGDFLVVPPRPNLQDSQISLFEVSVTITPHYDLDSDLGSDPDSDPDSEDSEDSEPESKSDFNCESVSE